MKILLTIVLSVLSIGLNAQYGSLNELLNRLEERRGVSKNLKDVNLDKAKFVLIKDFSDHTERSIIVLDGNQATYVEIFDDKETGQSTSNVFSGDVLRTENNIISLRADKLEGQQISLPITKTLLLTKQKKTLYLIDVNTKERWIEESAITKK